jgi:cytochrome c-type biogenesis protein CcmF
MIPELGHFALILALLLALLLGTLPIVGAQRGHAGWAAQARPLALGQGLFVLVAWACLVVSFVQNDFSVRNVAENSNSMLPLPYRVAASWGSHEGSMLLWLVMQALWMLAVARRSRELPPAVVARVLGVMGLLSAGFMLFVLATSNPFLRVFPIPAQGRDLNPLLQDPGMVLHPPLLYMGYVGFSVAFAFAIAALLGGRLDAAWARWSRPWTTLAWCFLTLGVALGSWWAYYELGWGGWWFWDPVENAAFMPWLVGTALIHALAVSEKRNLFQPWTVLLAILCFALSLLGTFLVRSGVLTSVHAFAIDPKRGVFILGLLLVTIGGALALFALRAPRAASSERFDALSRETLLLVNTLLLTVAAASVLLGTLYPLFVDVFGLGKLSVGPPYFDTVFVPLMAPVVFLMGVGPLARWKRASLPDLWTRLRWALVVGALLGAVLPFVWGGWSPLVAVGFFLALWLVLATWVSVHERLWGSRRGEPGLRRQPLGWWGMTVAHLGIAVFVVGVTIVRAYETEIDLRMAPGESVTVGGHVFTFQGVAPAMGPNYAAERGRFEVSRDGRSVATLQPEKRRYTSLPASPMTEAAIASSLAGDLYVALGEPAGQGAWTVRVYHKPFVTWIWGGCGLMVLGGLLAAGDRRYVKRSSLRAAVEGADSRSAQRA